MKKDDRHASRVGVLCSLLDAGYDSDIQIPPADTQMAEQR